MVHEVSIIMQPAAMDPIWPHFFDHTKSKTQKEVVKCCSLLVLLKTGGKKTCSPAALDPTSVTGTVQPSSRSPWLSRPPPGPPPALQRAAPSPHPRPPAPRISNASAAPRRTAEPKRLESPQRSPTWWPGPGSWARPVGLPQNMPAARVVRIIAFGS